MWFKTSMGINVRLFLKNNCSKKEWDSKGRSLSSKHKALSSNPVQPINK
jgi:hypothetical protein